MFKINKIIFELYGKSIVIKMIEIINAEIIKIINYLIT